ncbi:S8 family peptidase [Allobranchiibius sp. GilTou38]|nr:S8 family peptidase [Allobranchiibius sp. GilTou38]
MDPDLVFKIEAKTRPEDSSFEGRSLQVLGETVDYTYFVLAGDQGAALDDALQKYIQNGSLKSFFNQIDDIEPYGPADRTGPGIADLDVTSSDPITVDVSVWPSGTYEEAQRRARVIESVVTGSGRQILLLSVSARRTYFRVQVNASGLADLLNTSVVELVRTPPVPFLDFRDWRNLDIATLSRIEEPSEVVGVLDDSPESAHPLLNGLILSDESLAPTGYVWQQRGSHGTEVTGRVLFPTLHEELREAEPIRAVGAVRVVRILEPDPRRAQNPPRFATYALPHLLVEEAIRHLHGTYGVRIFNLSVGYDEPFSDVHVGPLTEVLDDLVRELGIVIVVPSGNAPIDVTARTPSGHHIIDDKPEFFFTPEHRIAEPAPAALAVTVGSLALSGAPAEIPSRVGWQAAAIEDEASPFSRTGPGLGTNKKRSNKPDVTHYGGNTVVNDTGNAIFNDPGASIVSTSMRGPSGGIFAAVNGTSYAAPAVARVAADIAYAYPDASANLIRALLVSGSVHTGPATILSETQSRTWIYGHGRPTTPAAIASDAHRVIMTFDGSMPVDTVQIHPLPVPDEFRSGAKRDRTITVALAFDPPVRRQRREYLAGTMKFEVYRDIDPDELALILQRQDPDDPSSPIKDRRKLDFQPGVNTFVHSTLQLRGWTGKQSFPNDSDTFYVAVTHKAQKWARNSPAYERQDYALAVTLEDRDLATADLYQILRTQLRVPTRVRLRA